MDEEVLVVGQTNGQNEERMQEWEHGWKNNIA